MIYRSHMNLCVGRSADSIFIDITSEDPARMRSVASVVILYLDATGDAVGVKLFDVSRRGGLQITDLDADADPS